MKIVVIGGTGLVGARVVMNLRAMGQEVNAAAISTGVNSVTGAGLTQALAGTDAVVDVAHSHSIADDDAMAFFTSSTRNLIDAERNAGVRHHIALSVVGVDRVPESGYLRARLAQEALIKTSGVPYTIVRSTQFFEFIDGIVESSTRDGQVHLSPAYVQPVAADDAAALIAKVATAVPTNEIMELAGPERFSLDELVRRYLGHRRDPRPVVADIHARYFDAEINDRSLTPGENPHIGATSFETWFRRLATR